MSKSSGGRQGGAVQGGLRRPRVVRLAGRTAQAALAVLLAVTGLAIAQAPAAHADDNRPPTAIDEVFTTDEDTPVDGTLTATDPEGDPLTFTLADRPPSNGTVTIDPDGTFTYTPDPDFTGPDDFRFQVADDNGGTDTGSVLVIVVPNAPPTADDQVFTTDEDTPVDGTLTATDPEGDPLTFTLADRPPSNGTVTIDPDGTFTYTPDPDFTGPDDFRFQVADDNGGTDTGSVLVIVVPNAPPTADDQVFTTDEDTPVDGTLTATDPEGDPLTFTLADRPPSNGTVTIDPDGTFTYTPDPDFTGPDDFRFQVADDNGGTDTGSVLVIVVPNAPPTADDQVFTTDEDTPVDGTLTATDPEGDPLTFTLADRPPSNGTVTIDPDGTFTYTPDPDFTGPDDFRFQVADDNGGTDTGSVLVIVVPNAPPTAIDEVFTTDEDTPVDGTLTATDPDGDTLAFTLVDSPTLGTVTIDPDGAFTYTPDPDVNGTDTFTFEVDDQAGNTDIGTVTIVVLPVNDAPVADDQAITAEDGTVVEGTLTATDVDGDTLTFGPGTVEPGLESVDIAADGTFTATPEPGFVGDTAFTFEVSDGTVTTTGTVTITYEADPQLATTLELEPGLLRLRLTGFTLGGSKLYLLDAEARLLTDDDQTPVVGREVTFSAGDTPLCTATTNFQGIATCTGAIAGRLSIILNLGYDGSFAGDDDFLASTGHGPLLDLFGTRLR